MLAASPATRCAGQPARSVSMASSDASRPSSRPISSARSSTSRRKTCGVCARKMSSRGSVAAIGRDSSVRAPPACFTVSLTGSAAIAAPCSTAAAMVRSIRAADTNGRAASWMAMTLASARARATAFATESCRRAPPSTQRTCDHPSSLIRAGHRRHERGRQRDDHLRDSGMRGEPFDAALEQRSPTDLQELLRQVGAKSHAPPAGRDDRRDDGHRRRHACHRACSRPPQISAMRSAVASSTRVSRAGAVSAGA